MSHFDYTLDEAVEEMRSGDLGSSALSRIKWDIGPGTATKVEGMVEEGDYEEAADYVEQRR